MKIIEINELLYEDFDSDDQRNIEVKAEVLINNKQHSLDIYATERGSFMHSSGDFITPGYTEFIDSVMTITDAILYLDGSAVRCIVSEDECIKIVDRFYECTNQEIERLSRNLPEEL